jgi:hypothetical protein
MADAQSKVKSRTLALGVANGTRETSLLDSAAARTFLTRANQLACLEAAAESNATHFKCSQWPNLTCSIVKYVFSSAGAWFPRSVGSNFPTQLGPRVPLLPTCQVLGPCDGKHVRSMGFRKSFCCMSVDGGHSLPIRDYRKDRRGRYERDKGSANTLNDYLMRPCMRPGLGSRPRALTGLTMGYQSPWRWIVA